MIEGAEILNKTEVFVSEPSTLTKIIIAAVAILLIIGLIKAIWSMDTSKMFSSLLSALMLVIIVLLILPKTYEDIPAGYQYDVYAEDDEVIKALYEKYEIVGANGNIYTVKEKAE